MIWLGNKLVLLVAATALAAAGLFMTYTYANASAFGPDCDTENGLDVQLPVVGGGAGAAVGEGSADGCVSTEDRPGIIRALRVEKGVVVMDDDDSVAVETTGQVCWSPGWCDPLGPNRVALQQGSPNADACTDEDRATPCAGETTLGPISLATGDLPSVGPGDPEPFMCIDGECLYRPGVDFHQAIGSDTEHDTVVVTVPGGPTFNADTAELCTSSVGACES